eukprot:TRINITY_DN1105_c0_g1_i2.p1 TRINITY_DN1105_c0_g1~~TRINITY_DN1105_c0_g1_i2.p1  ORF type:complete len:224 (+),score=61.46 TRINITY_DN1105_c0_g1_i2:193-864(+)
MGGCASSENEGAQGPKGPYKSLTEDEVARHTKDFNAMDEDHNANIDRDEARKYLKNLGMQILGNPPPEDLWHQRLDKEVDEMFENMDENHDQVISLIEYLDAHAKAKQCRLDRVVAEQQEPFKCLTKEESVRYAMEFYTMDKDHSRSVDKAEARAYLQHLGMQVLGNPAPAEAAEERLDKEVEEMFAQMDENRDEKISLSEYLTAHAAAKQVKLDQEKEENAE